MMMAPVNPDAMPAPMLMMRPPAVVPIWPKSSELYQSEM